MRALSRRGNAKESHLVRYKNMVLDPFARALSIEGQEVELTEKEYLLVEILIRNSERPLTRREIAEYVWQNATDSTNIVDVYVNFLRKKIETISHKKYIQTVRGTGYILKEEK